MKLFFVNLKTKHNKIDCLKIDAESSRFLILQGMKKQIEMCIKSRIYCLECKAIIQSNSEK